MTIRDIHCAVLAAKGAESPAFRQALRLAGESKAHLAVTLASPKIAVPFSPFYASLAHGLVAETNDAARSAAAAIETVMNDAGRIAGVTHDVTLSHDHLTEIATAVAVRARVCDLVVIDQPVDMVDVLEELLETALFESGRPVLVVPEGREPFERPARALVAWDGSLHAARAVGDLVGLFGGRVAQVDILSVVGEKMLPKSLVGADLSRHFARHGIETNLVERSAGSRSVAQVIDDTAAETAADMIVMGGFGHSRLRELVFGGVTRWLISNARRPLLMSY